jgi:integrase
MADVWVMKQKGRYAQDEMVIAPRLAHEIGAWLGAYADAHGPLVPEYYLFPRLDDRLSAGGREFRLYPDTPMAHPQAVIRHALDAVGVTEGRRGFHDVRRSMARLRYDALCEEGHPDPLGVIKALLHHADRRTTEHYIGIDAARTRRNKAMRSATWLSVLPMADSDETARTSLATVVRLHG